MADRHPLLEHLTPARQDLVRRCAEAGVARGEAVYLVGGPVRDLLLGAPVEDIDVVVVGDGLGVAQHAARAVGGRLTRYHAFGTARIDLADGHRLDVATARAESYQRPGVLPEVRPGSLADDLGRRDFTINAMAIGLGGVAGNDLEDPLGGRDDLHAGVVRILHEGSFVDDPSRMLRAVRFALRFDYVIEPVTARVLADGVRGGYLESISGDRLRREFAKLLQEQPVAGPQRLQSEGLLATVDGALRADVGNLGALAETVGQLGQLRPAVAAQPRWTFVLACLAAGADGQSRWRLCRRLRLSRDERQPLVDGGAPWSRALDHVRARDARPSDLAAALDPLCEGAVVVGCAALRGAGDTAAAERVERYLLHDRDLRGWLDAVALARLGCPAGPMLGELLRVLRAARIDARTADAGNEAEFARQWLRDRQIDPPGGP